MILRRSLEATLKRPGNHAEQAFARGYHEIAKGITGRCTFSRRNHHDYRHYLEGRRLAKRHLRCAKKRGGEDGQL